MNNKEYLKEQLKNPEFKKIWDETPEDEGFNHEKGFNPYSVMKIDPEDISAPHNHEA